MTATTAPPNTDHAALDPIENRRVADRTFLSAKVNARDLADALATGILIAGHGNLELVPYFHPAVHPQGGQLQSIEVRAASDRLIASATLGSWGGVVVDGQWAPEEVLATAAKTDLTRCGMKGIRVGEWADTATLQTWAATVRRRTRTDTAATIKMTSTTLSVASGDTKAEVARGVTSVSHAARSIPVIEAPLRDDQPGYVAPRVGLEPLGIAADVAELWAENRPFAPGLVHIMSPDRAGDPCVFHIENHPVTLITPTLTSGTF